MLRVAGRIESFHTGWKPYGIITIITITIVITIIIIIIIIIIVHHEWVKLRASCLREISSVEHALRCVAAQRMARVAVCVCVCVCSVRDFLLDMGRPCLPHASAQCPLPR